MKYIYIYSFINSLILTNLFFDPYSKEQPDKLLYYKY